MFYKHDYGLTLPKRFSARLLEGFCYQKEHGPENGGVGAYEHLRRYIGLTWPDLMLDEWYHPWMEWRMRIFADPDMGVTRREMLGVTTNLFRSNIWTGCASSGKTHDAGLLSLAWWSCNPHHSSVVLCSTSKQMIRRRVWPVIQKLYHAAKDHNGKPLRIGYLLDSQTMLQAKRGDSKHAVAAFAVEPGELQSSIGKMKGMHTERMMLVVDEADSTPSAVFELISNFRKGCREFVLLVVGNGVSMLDAHGQLAEPSAGWESVSVESEEWETKPTHKWNIDRGYCLHFDGEKSPNVKLGRTKWPFLYTYEDYLGAKGKPDYAGSIQYWSFERGFWAPEGAVNRVLTPQKIIRHNARDSFIWINKATPCGGLDPAFGGNQCVLQFGVFGDAEEQENAIELTDTVEIHPQAKSDLPVDNQIAQRVIDECAERGVTPEHFGLDTTGPGRSIAALLAANWSNRFVRVEFGGSASDDPVGFGDERSAKEVYANKVTELWFTVAQMVEHDKLRGLPVTAGNQFCSRPYDMKGKRLCVLPKDKMREFHGKSPDHADAVAVLCAVAKRYGIGQGRGGRNQGSGEWTRFQREADDVWSTPGTAEDRVVAHETAEYNR